MLLSFVYELYLNYTYSYPKLHMLSNAIPPIGEKLITTGLLSVYCMKGKIFCGLASLFLDFTDRVQALCCICHHVTSLHDRRFFHIIQEREGIHKVSDERQTCQTHAFPHPVVLVHLIHFTPAFACLTNACYAG